MMPHPNQSLEAYIAECQSAGGVGVPRATPEQIERLKALGYKIESFSEDADPSDDLGIIVGYQWFAPNGDFQDCEPSYAEDDCWALALEHAIEHMIGWTR